MPNPALIGLGISVGSGILGSLLGGKSPAEERLESILAELDKGFVAQGLSQAERAELLRKASISINKRARTRLARSSASIARRSGGVAQPQVLGRLSLGIGNQAASDVSEAERGILSKHLEIARQRYDDLQRQATLLSTSIPQDDIFGTLGQLGQNVGQLVSTQEPTQEAGTLGGNFNPDRYLSSYYTRNQGLSAF